MSPYCLRWSSWLLWQLWPFMTIWSCEIGKLGHVRPQAARTSWAQRNLPSTSLSKPLEQPNHLVVQSAELKSQISVGETSCSPWRPRSPEASVHTFIFASSWELQAVSSFCPCTGAPPFKAPGHAIELTNNQEPTWRGNPTAFCPTSHQNIKVFERKMGFGKDLLLLSVDLTSLHHLVGS